MVKTPLFPTYQKVRKLLPALEGVDVNIYANMWATIWAATGTPQNPVDWKNPDNWIFEKLSGDEAELANKIWTETDNHVNPRHIRGSKFLIDGYNLLESASGCFKLTQRGQEFLNSGGTIEREIDLSEGCVRILRSISLQGTCKRSDLYDDWKDYLLNHSNYRTVSVINDSLTRRLKNIAVRELVDKSGNQYTINEAGQNYLESFDTPESPNSISEEVSLANEIDKFNQMQRKELYRCISTMDPFQFEHVIKELLLAMGYDDVKVTSPSNDKGVDVVGSIQKGISNVIDVIQVKRNTTGNIQRKILDALRGSLHRFNAFQGTIITTSDYSKGTKEAAFEVGAAPITLINGEKLLDLMIEYNIGIRKKQTTFFTVDAEYFEIREEDIGED